MRHLSRNLRKLTNEDHQSDGLWKGARVARNGARGARKGARGARKGARSARKGTSGSWNGAREVQRKVGKHGIGLTMPRSTSALICQNSAKIITQTGIETCNRLDSVNILILLQVFQWFISHYRNYYISR